MSASLQFRAGHQLTMTPFLQRSIQLLQLSSLEFQQQVQELMGTNPFIENTALEDGPDEATDSVASDAESDSPDIEAQANAELDDAWTGESFELRSNRPVDDDWDPMMRVPSRPTLREHLHRQAGCLRIGLRDRVILQTLIDAVDASGYLTTPLEEILPLCPPEVEADQDDLRIALLRVQAMDPVGVGARSVAECLTLQLQACEHDLMARELALKIVIDHLGVLAVHDFQRLQKLLGCEASALQAAIVLLRSLTPRPGAGFGSEETQFVVADVIVQRHLGKWVAVINPEVIPKIQVSRFYANILKGRRDGGSAVSEQMREARWLVRNVEQRFETIQRVAQATIDHQSRFFEYGPLAMRPLTLGEIADGLGLHESTVSRVTSRKYMATPSGLFEFKHFFGSHVETAAGAPCSSIAVRALITELIGTESADRPLSDIKLTRLLEQRGIKVARRTVSKYRDALQIPSVDVRRMSHRPML